MTHFFKFAKFQSHHGNTPPPLSHNPQIARLRSARIGSLHAATPAAHQLVNLGAPVRRAWRGGRQSLPIYGGKRSLRPGFNTVTAAVRYSTEDGRRPRPRPSKGRNGWMWQAGTGPQMARSAPITSHVASGVTHPTGLTTRMKTQPSAGRAPPNLRRTL